MANNASTIWTFLTGQGMTPAAAAGVMGNLEQESGLNPAAVNSSSGAYGLAQWLGGRKTNLIQYASAHGEAPTSLDAQLGYLMKEINGGSEGVSVASLNKFSSPADAADFFSNKFERAGSGANNARREQLAEKYYKQYNGKTPPEGTGAGDSSGSGFPGATPTATGSSHSSKSFARGSDFIGIIDKSLSIKDFDIMHPVNSLTQDAGAIALRIVFVLMGLIIFIFGLVAIVEKVAPGTPIPIPV